MNEKPEALALSQLLLLHADSITDSGVKDMVINAATELAVLHAENERLRDELRQSSVDCTRAEVERLREALDKSLTDEQIRQIAASIDRSMPIEPAKILFARRIEAALRREEP